MDLVTAGYIIQKEDYVVVVRNNQEDLSFDTVEEAHAFLMKESGGPPLWKHPVKYCVECVYPVPG